MVSMRVTTVSILRENQLKMGRFIIRRSLGGGRYGKVFLAVDPALGRQVAIKWLSPVGCNYSPAGSANSPNETSLVAKLDHPNIVPLYETGMFRDSPYLVYAYVAGMTLHDKCARDGIMSAGAALELFSAILAGVACAHAKGIPHLALSPGNILIDAAGVPHVMDFGVALMPGINRESGGDGATRSRCYLSPEHFSDRPLTSRADVFVLGLILYELLSGRSPLKFDGSRIFRDVIANGELDLSDMSRLSLDEKLRAVIWRALSYDAERRYAHAADMKRAVDELLGRNVKAGDQGAVKRLLERMEQQKKFPALTNNLLEINRLTDENNPSNIGKLSNIVLRDYAITKKLLQLANSSFYGSARNGVKTVSNAIQLLGMNNVRTTCNGLVYFSAMKGGDQHLEDVMISSFISALIGRHFAIRLQRKDLAEEAFIGSMFYRLGKSLAIFYFRDEFQQIERLIEAYSLDDEAASARVLGISYGDLGVAIAAHWKFPESIQESIKCLGPGMPPKPARFVEFQQQIAAFSNELCELASCCPEEQRMVRLNEFVLRFGGIIFISPEELVQLLEAAFKRLKEFSPMLGLDLRRSRYVSRVGNFLMNVRPLVKQVAAFADPPGGAVS